MGRNRSENPRLGMFGVVNADMWAKMDERTKLYDVTARYTLLDCRYNQRGEVLYELEWSRAAHAKIVNHEQEV